MHHQLAVSSILAAGKAVRLSFDLLRDWRVPRLAPMPRCSAGQPASRSADSSLDSDSRKYSGRRDGLWSTKPSVVLLACPTSRSRRSNIFARCCCSPLPHGSSRCVPEREKTTKVRSLRTMQGSRTHLPPSCQSAGVFVGKLRYV
jgi:hypothetical protein